MSDELCPLCGSETLVLDDAPDELSCAWCEWSRPLVELPEREGRRAALAIRPDHIHVHRLRGERRDEL